jgi:hypothetical protein
MGFLGGHQRKTLSQIEPHLIAKYTPGARTGAVCFVVAMGYNMLQEI